MTYFLVGLFIFLAGSMTIDHPIWSEDVSAPQEGLHRSDTKWPTQSRRLQQRKTPETVLLEGECCCGSGWGGGLSKRNKLKHFFQCRCGSRRPADTSNRFYLVNESMKLCEPHEAVDDPFLGSGWHAFLQSSTVYLRVKKVNEVRTQR